MLVAGYRYSAGCSFPNPSGSERLHRPSILTADSACLAERLSKVADVPVAPDDGLTKFICGICNRKLLSAESFIRTAKASYAKNKASPSGSGTSDTMGSQAQITRKRTKDTSGPEASPHTSQCRPVAKRLTPERPGRRLTYPDCHNY
ncbi:hypothetical protein EMCRGX_G003436 [Ephydatia muelleri]